MKKIQKMDGGIYSDAEIIFNSLKGNKSPFVEEMAKRFKVLSDKEKANNKFYS